MTSLAPVLQVSLRWIAPAVKSLIAVAPHPWGQQRRPAMERDIVQTLPMGLVGRGSSREGD